MKLGLVFCSLILFGISAIAAKAQTPVDPHETLNKPDPACPSGDFCADLVWEGGTEHVPSLTFLVPNPPGELAENPPIYSCSTNVFTMCKANDNSSVIPPVIGTEIFSFQFYGGNPLLTDGDTFIYFTDQPIGELILPAGLCPISDPECSLGTMITLSPEPGTSLLYMTGLVFLVAFTTKRFGANFRT